MGEIKNALEQDKPWRRFSSVTVALTDNPSDFTMGLPISFCVLGFVFCKLTKTERSSSSKLLAELSWFYTSSRGSSTFDGLLVLSEFEVSAIKIGGFC